MLGGVFIRLAGIVLVFFCITILGKLFKKWRVSQSWFIKTFQFLSLLFYVWLVIGCEYWTASSGSQFKPFLLYFAYLIFPIAFTALVVLLGFSGRFVVHYRVATKRRQSRQQENALELMQDASQTPILLLRSFQDDVALEGQATKIMERQARFMETSFEQFIAPIFKQFGPVLAVSRPGEEYSPLGAARMGISDDWKSDVKKLIKVSRLVPLIVGATPGVGDEMRFMYELECPEKLLLMFPFPPEIPYAHHERWTNFRHACNDMYKKKGLSLPERVSPKTLFFSVASDWRLQPISCFEATREEYQKVLKRFLSKRFPEKECRASDVKLARETVFEIAKTCN